MKDNLKRTVGAVVGGVLGILVYWLLLRYGYAAIAVVGAGLALGVSAMAPQRDLLGGILTSITAVLLMVLVAWWFSPFAADPSLGYFLTHLPDLSRNTLISVGVVAVLGLYFGLGRRSKKSDK